MADSTVTVWDGSAEQPTLNTIWDGLAEQLISEPLLPIGGGGGGGGVTPSYGLFYSMPDSIRNYDKKVFAHYFGPYPRSLENASTVQGTGYYKAFNNPNYSAYSSFGGYFHDAPLFRAPLSNDWQVQDCKFDIITAMNAGLDGFFCDLLGLSGSNYNNYNYLKQALRELRATDSKYNSFYVMAMVDANGATAAAPAATAGGYVQSFSDTSYYLPDGRMMWSCFLAEGKPASYWQGVADYLTGQSIPNAFVSVFNNYGQAPNYYSVSYGVSAWGLGADPTCINSASNQTGTAHSNGKVYMHPATQQDTRPRNQLFDEACNTEALRATWNKAINDGADYVQVVTWSDFSEAPTAPSMQRGFCTLDLTGYYLIKYKTGAFPDILKDQIYLSHRDELFGSTQTAATITGPETTPMQHWPRGTTSAVRNTVEVLSFLTDAADITVTVGGVPTTYTAPAGMYAHTVPLAIGAAPSAVAKRNGTTVAQVTSVVAVSSSVVVDDAGYYVVTSGDRGTAGQMRPNGT